MISYQPPINHHQTRVFILTSPSSFESATCSVEILAGSMASLGRGSGRACDNPNESQRNMFSRLTFLASSLHQMSHDMRQILSPCPWFSTIFLMLYTGMHQSRLLKTDSLPMGWPSTQQGSQPRRSPQCCQRRHPERSHQVTSGHKMKE